MKDADFLKKLAKQKKIQLVELSIPVQEAYLQRAEESLSSAKALAKIHNLKDAVALAYYAMYHSLLALLFRCGIKCENHTAAILLLKEIFELDNTSIIKAKAERVDKQYYVDFSVTADEVTECIKIAENFIATIHSFIASLNQKSIRKYYEKTEKILKENRVAEN